MNNDKLEVTYQYNGISRTIYLEPLKEEYTKPKSKPEAWYTKLKAFLSRWFR